MSSTTLKTLTAAAALLALAGTADAEMRVTGQFGPWGTSAGTNVNHERMCNAYVGGTNRSFFLKYGEGWGALHLQLYKTGWNVPSRQPVTFVVQVDQAPTMTFNGVGTGKLDGTNMGGIDVEIKPSDTWFSGKPMDTELLSLIKEGKQLQVYFPNGNEEPWQGPLTGSTGALISFSQCVLAISTPASQPFAAAPASTQPFAAPQTQPFTAAPTQPFAEVPHNNL